MWTSEFILSVRNDVMMEYDLNMVEKMRYSEIVRLVLKVHGACRKQPLTFDIG